MKTIGERISDMLIANCDEDELEEKLEREWLSGAVGPRDTSSVRDALNRIDNLKASGTYQAVRDELTATLAADNEALVGSPFLNINPVAAEIITRLTEPMRTASPAMRAKIEKLWATVRDENLWEVMECLLEPPKGVGGSPRGRRYPEDLPRLREMKLLVRRGESIPEASRIVAEQITPQKMVSTSSVAKRLERAYRHRQHLRAGTLGEIPRR
jgi:hypothetical protein